jgi:hypothetical protein
MKTYRKAAAAWLAAKLERAWDLFVGWVTNLPVYRRFDAWADAHPWKARAAVVGAASLLILVAGAMLAVVLDRPQVRAPFALISPHDVIVSVPPPVPMPASASPKDLAPLTLLKVKDPSAKKKAAHKRRPKPRVSSARSDTRF